MGRKPDPKIKLNLLEMCTGAAIEKGSLNLTIHEYAEISGTSARMLIYHFDSKENLNEQIAIQLEKMMRQEFTRYFDANSAGENTLLEFWDHATGNSKFKKLAVLSMTMMMSPKVRSSFKKEMEKQTIEWIKTIRKHFSSDQAAETAFLIAQGAMIDFFVTGNKERGRRCLLKSITLS
jgi:AcrR family transcriptional regulator